jgi:hypothetical protein
VPEFIDPVFTKTSPKRSFSLNRKRAFWLVFAKTVYNFGHGSGRLYFLHMERQDEGTDQEGAVLSEEGD